VARQGFQRALGVHAGFLLLYLLLAFALLAPMSLDASRRLPDDGDSLQGLWILWWSATHVFDDPENLFDANAYYPHPRGLVYSEPLLAEAILALPVLRPLDNRVLAVNLLTILTLALSALACHVLARELTGSHLGGFLAACLYAFNAYMFSSLAQLQLISAQWIPLALVCLHRFFTRERIGYAMGFAAFTALVGLSSFYYLVFFSVALGVLVPVYLFSRRLRRPARSLAWFCVFTLVALGLLYGVTAPYREIFERYRFTGAPELFDLGQFFTPPLGSLLYGDLGAFRLTTYFTGYLSLLLAAAGALSLTRKSGPGDERTVWFAYLLVGVAAFACAAGPQIVVAGQHLGPGPFRLLQWIGPFEKLREPARFAVLVYLALGLFLARGVTWLLQSVSIARQSLTGALIAGLLLAEHWSPLRTQGTPIPTGDDVPEAYRWLGNHDEQGPVAELPVRPFRQIRRTSMEAYFSTFHRRPILFAKPSFYPPAMELLQWELREFPDARSVALLQALEVRFALVHPGRWQEDRDLRLRRLERLESDLVPVKEFPEGSYPLWSEYQLGGELLYRVSPARARTPASGGLPCDCREIDRSSFRLAASEPAAELAIDGDRDTKWSTTDGQQKGDYFEVAFDRPRRPVRVELEMAFPYGEFPRNLEMNGYQGERGYRVSRVEDVEYTVELVRQLIRDPSKARLRYDLEPMVMDRLRLFIQRTEEGTIDWSVPEIHIYETASDEGASAARSRRLDAPVSRLREVSP
jgi:hypothetical protein